jgi:hypothetical protein
MTQNSVLYPHLYPQKTAIPPSNNYQPIVVQKPDGAHLRIIYSYTISYANHTNRGGFGSR